jgi:hypothetical protein
MSDNSIIEKIRKLLAMGERTAGNEHEAAQAMSLASRLMMEHGIRQDQVSDKKPDVTYGEVMGLDDWQRHSANAASNLYACSFVFNLGGKHHKAWVQFVGRADNIAAAKDTFEFINRQIEASYKAHLPPKLTKAERAHYRRDFKRACAYRVSQRAAWIVMEMQRATAEQAAAQASELGASNSTALVVRQHREELREEIDAFFEKEKIKTAKNPPAIRPSQATLDGSRAGNDVSLRREISVAKD